MIVVADTSPILYLVLIEHVELLQSFYSDVVLPEVVATELRATKSPREQLDAVTVELDPGERAAIALATALSANLLLIDDTRGRAEAHRRHLRVTGTLGVLRTAAERGLINVPDVLGRLRATSFYVEDALVEEVFGTWL